MFIQEPLRIPSGAAQSYEVVYAKGRKPFPDRKQADVFAKEQRALDGGWAEVSHVIKIVVDKRG